MVMTQQEKQILLKDLCARIPYRTFVQLNPGAYNKPETCILTGVNGERVHLNVDSDSFRIDNIKPYLRSTESMTEDEEKELEETLQYTQYTLESYDWLNEHHLDYRGLIEIGLALEAKPEMYKI